MFELKLSQTDESLFQPMESLNPERKEKVSLAQKCLRYDSPSGARLSYQVEIAGTAVMELNHNEVTHWLANHFNRSTNRFARYKIWNILLIEPQGCLGSLVITPPSWSLIIIGAG